MLLNHGAQIERGGDNGSTPLMIAASANKVDTVRLLLEKGANVNAKSASGDTALAYAVIRGASEELLKTLINSGANVNDKNSAGDSLLNLATKKGATKVEAILRGYGAVE